MLSYFDMLQNRKLTEFETCRDAVIENFISTSSNANYKNSDTAYQTLLKDY